MTLEIDVPGTVSDNLAIVIDAELNNPDGVQPATLGSVLEAMHHGLVTRLVDGGRIEGGEDETIYSEIETLIERYGADRLAQDFMRYRASENLAVVIRAVLESHEGDQPPTLGSVYEAMSEGMVAQLIGAGEIDPDEDETLIFEIQRLINLHGENAPAEDYLP